MVICEKNKNGDIIHFKDAKMEYWQKYDKQHRPIHIKYSDGYNYWQKYAKKGNKSIGIHTLFPSGFETWYDYDKKDNLIHYKESTGYEFWIGKLELNDGKYYFDKKPLSKFGTTNKKRRDNNAT